jgi:3-methylcrotonyl-CoA carboxylase alpha subunit
MTAVRLRHGAVAREVRVEKDSAFLDGRRLEFERRDFGGRLAGITIEGREHRVATARAGNRVFVWCEGFPFSFERVSTTRTSVSRDSSGDLIAPMPGRVRRTLVSTGQTVARGQVLIILEAMKMEHSIRAPRDGSVRLCVREGDLVDAGAELAQIE